jgi:hypothetical protein
MKCTLLDSCLLPAITALMFLNAAGCSTSSSSGAVASEMAALDQAYRAGVFTKDEYAAKKKGIESQAKALEALEKALAAGVISNNDYPAMKARLIAKGTAIAALEQAHQAGVFSDQEYARRKAAIEATPSPSSVASAAVAAQAPAPGAVPSPAPATNQPPMAGGAVPAVPADSGHPKPRDSVANNAHDSTKGPTDPVIVNGSGTYLFSSTKGVQRIGAGSKNVLPSWVPVYPGATTTSTTTEPDGAHTRYALGLESPDSLKMVVDFYRTQLPGFKTTSSYMDNKAASLIMDNGKYTFTLSAGHFPTNPVTNFTVMVEDK